MRKLLSSSIKLHINSSNFLCIYSLPFKVENLCVVSWYSKKNDKNYFFVNFKDCIVESRTQYSKLNKLILLETASFRNILKKSNCKKIKNTLIIQYFLVIFEHFEMLLTTNTCQITGV